MGVSLYVLSVGEISYKFMDFTFDMYFRQFWIDERLKFDNGKVRVVACPVCSNEGCPPQSGVEKLVVGADYIKLIWVPDTFFVNEKTAQFHAATQVKQYMIL